MSDIQEIGKGCDVDGRFVEPVGVMKETEFLRVVVEEGRNREVHRLCFRSCISIGDDAIGSNTCGKCRVAGEVSQTRTGWRIPNAIWSQAWQNQVSSSKVIEI